MAMSDRILLLNNGVIEQETGTEAMDGATGTLATADFMGRTNRIEGQVAEINGAAARLVGEGWSLWGQARGAAAKTLKAGSPATGMGRLPRGPGGPGWVGPAGARLADGPGDNRARLPVVTSMYLGDRWEHLFHLGATR